MVYGVACDAFFNGFQCADAIHIMTPVMQTGAVARTIYGFWRTGVVQGAVSPIILGISVSRLCSNFL